MIFELLNVKNYIPFKSVKRVQDINFEELYKNGKRVVLTDLDNTLISYAYDEPNEDMTSFIRGLETIGYTVIIISNSPASRVNRFLKALDLKGISYAKKPLKSGMKQALEFVDAKKEEMVFLGDQLMTDVLVGNRMNIETYLVDAIERKSEKWYTKINRTMEKFVVRRIKRKYSSEYNEKLSERYGR